MIEVDEATATPPRLTKVIYQTVAGELRWVDGDRLTLPQRMQLLEWQQIAAEALGSGGK